MSLTGGYYRSWYAHFLTTDNLAVTSADYNPYCITAPVDARLPDGGGYPVCGLYDVSLAKFGQVNNLVTHSSNFGKQTQVNDFFDVGVNTRLQLGSPVRRRGGHRAHGQRRLLQRRFSGRRGHCPPRRVDHPDTVYRDDC